MKIKRRKSQKQNNKETNTPDLSNALVTHKHELSEKKQEVSANSLQSLNQLTSRTLTKRIILEKRSLRI